MSQRLGARRRIEALEQRIQALTLENVRLDSLSYEDGLTGVPNRRAFERLASAVHSDAKRTLAPYVVAIIDIDHFKKVNDSYGHPVGDLVLKAVSAEIMAHKRGSELFARWGGEEFAFLLPHPTKEDATKVLERLRTLVENLEIRLENGTCIKVTISIGYSVWGSNVTLEALVTQADQALYCAKQTGRNRVVQF